MPSTPNTRRALVTLTAAAVAARTVLPTAARAAPMSRVQALWQRYLVAHRRAEKGHNAASALRHQFVTRYGEPAGTDVPAEAIWGHDPRYSALEPLNDESNRLACLAYDALDELMRCPSRSTADLRVKLAAVLHEWRQIGAIGEGGEYHEQMAFTLMQDAEGVLGPLELA